MEKNFEIIQKDGFHEITIIGKLLQEGIADEILVALEKNLETGELNYLLNLSQLSYVNSSGIALFIRILTKVRTKGGELIVHNPNSIIQRLFTITKLDQVFQLVGSEQEATDFYKK
jgi:anti-anti-sigma factor